MTLTIPNCRVSVTERGASVEYMGGSLWVPKEGLAGFKPGEYASLVLSVRLYSGRSGDRSFTGLRVVGLIGK